MKRTLLFLLTAISLAVTSCEYIQSDTDVEAITLEMFVHDNKWNNLLEKEGFDAKDITATFRGETYELKEETKAYTPEFEGFIIKSNKKGRYLYFGELDGTEDFNDDFVIRWSDGYEETIRIYNKCTADLINGYNVKRTFTFRGNTYEAPTFQFSFCQLNIIKPVKP